MKASKLAGEELLGRLDYYAKAWLPARTLVADGLTQRAKVDPHGRIILFEQFAPWKVSLWCLSGSTFFLHPLPWFLAPSIARLRFPAPIRV